MTSHKLKRSESIKIEKLRNYSLVSRYVALFHVTSCDGFSKWVIYGPFTRGLFRLDVC